MSGLFAGGLPIVGGGGGAVAAADITDATATGIALVTAADAAAARTAIGAAAVATTVGTAAAQQRLDTSLRTAPLAVQGTSAAVGWAGATAAVDHMPIARSTSGVVVLYSTSAGGHAQGFMVHRGVWPTRGAYVSISGADGLIVPMNAAGVTYATLADVAGTVGWHAVAWSISADGATVRYSVDGGAAASATITSGPLTFVAPDTGDAPHVLYDSASAGSAVPVAYVGLWDAILSDADLVLLSDDPSEGAPDLDAISGADPDWEWCAAAAAGADRLVIEGVTYSVTATRPLVWAR